MMAMINLNNLRERFTCINQNINQKKYYDKFIHEGIPHYNLYFNNKISKIITRTTTYSFLMKLNYIMILDSLMEYSFELKNCLITIVKSTDFIYIDYEFKNYTKPNIKDYFNSSFYFASDYYKYYVIDIKNVSLTNITVNSLKFNIQKEGEVIFFRNKYIYYHHFDFILVTKEVVMFLKSDTRILYICENNVNINSFKYEFRSGFELFLRNNNFSFVN
jgi:hypothetical protein